jgi:DNA-binding LytR/AlgR family response regulator
LGYILLNVSLSRDYLRQSADYAAANAVKLVDLKTETDIETISVSETIDNENSQYVSALRVRGTAGDTFLKAEECYYFEASDHSSLVYNSNGMFRVSMSIANLAKQLDPDYFFQNNPKHIINLAYLDSFIYTEKGQYALNFKKPIEVSLTTTKSRVEALKIAFEKYRTLRMV